MHACICMHTCMHTTFFMYQFSPLVQLKHILQMHAYLHACMPLLGYFDIICSMKSCHYPWQPICMSGRQPSHRSLYSVLNYIYWYAKLQFHLTDRGWKHTHIHACMHTQYLGDFKANCIINCLRKHPQCVSI